MAQPVPPPQAFCFPVKKEALLLYTIKGQKFVVGVPAWETPRSRRLSARKPEPAACRTWLPPGPRGVKIVRSIRLMFKPEPSSCCSSGTIQCEAFTVKRAGRHLHRALDKTHPPLRVVMTLEHPVVRVVCMKAAAKNRRRLIHPVCCPQNKLYPPERQLNNV